MKTEVFKNSIGNAPEIIMDGGLVGVPTETVYGLACNGLDADAVKKVYEVKGRPEAKPLSLMVSGKEDIDSYCINVPYAAYHFADKYWPGPLTIVLEANGDIPSVVLAGGNTVGLRCPDSDLTLELLKKCRLPLAAPSANISGKPSPKSADEVLSYFDGQIDAVIDGGVCGVGEESTILDLSFNNVAILRKGALKTRIIGITGHSGAGKTSVLGFLENMGCAVIECDKLYHELLESSKQLNDELYEAFPECYEDGKLNRKSLSGVVFSDKTKLSLLNRITHRHISYAVIEKILDYNNDGYAYVAIDASELLVSPLKDVCDLLVGVVADPELRIKRIMDRDSIPYGQAEKRITAQKDSQYFIDNCHRVIVNNSTFEDLINRCKEVFENG